MKVIIRTDASEHIGSGHAMRCLTLAVELRQRGWKVVFVCRDLPGHFGDIIVQNGFECCLLPAGRASVEAQETDAEHTIAALVGHWPVDWIVIDHYDFDATWHRAVRHVAKRLMVIDDLANRPLDCDLLLDQTDYEDPVGRYKHLVPPSAYLCLGAKWILLRNEFRQARQTLRRMPGPVRRILVTFGANDPVGMTGRALAILGRSKYQHIYIDIICGRANPCRDALMSVASKIPHVRARIHAQDVADSMIAADLSLGGAGMTTWERCALGLPSLVIGLADNQRDIGAFLSTSELACWLGPAEDLSDAALEAAIDTAIADVSWRQAVSARSMQTVCGDGVIHLADLFVEALSHVSTGDWVQRPRIMS